MLKMRTDNKKLIKTFAGNKNIIYLCIVKVIINIFNLNF